MSPLDQELDLEQHVGAEDGRVNYDDVKDHGIEEELVVQVTNSQSDEEIRIQRQAPKGHVAKVDEVHDLICSIDRWHRTSGAELGLYSMLFVLPFFEREACAEFRTLPDLDVRS